MKISSLGLIAIAETIRYTVFPINVSFAVPVLEIRHAYSMFHTRSVPSLNMK
jgi:hypothetical protein